MRLNRILRNAFFCGLIGILGMCGTGLAGSPDAAVSPTALSFGTTVVGVASSAKTVSITNSGTATLTISSISADNSAFAISHPTLPLSLAPSQSTQFSVTFKAPVAGTTSGWLSVYSNSPYTPNSLTVSGSGTTSTTTTKPVITISPSSLAFGNHSVGTASATQTVTITNTSAITANVTNVVSSNSSFALTKPFLPLTLAASQSIKVPVTFKPSATGSLTSTIGVYSNAKYSPVTTLATGAGTSSSTATVTVNPGAITFADQTAGTGSAAQSVTITNTGTVNATVSALSVNNSNFALTKPTLPATLAPAQTLKTSVTFKPASTGSFTGVVSVSTTAQASPSSVSVSGKGVTKSSSGGLKPSPTSLSFANETLNVTSAAQTVTLTNSGTTSISVSGLSVTPSQFKIISKPTLPLSLAAGASTTVGIGFDPTVSSTLTGSLTVTSTASPTTSTVTLSGSGSSGGNLTGLTMLTNSLHSGYLQQAYSASILVSGGVAPYTYGMSSGQLPAGLTLNASTGKITGTPTQAGSFSLGIDATDSSSSHLGTSGTFTMVVASGVYDQYGGITEQACSNGAAAHFYTQEINGRWWLCTPAGHAFFMRGVYHVDDSDDSPDYQGVILGGKACTSSSPASTSNPCSVIAEKYGDNTTTWGPQIVQRLKGWGFNASAEYSSAYVQPTTTNSSWTTADQSNPQKMAFSGLIWPSHYARNANSYANPVKDLVGPLNASYYTDLRHPSPDVFDPNFGKWIAGDLADYTNAEYNWIHSSHSDYLVGLNFDDTDELYGFGAGPDFDTLSNGNEVADKWHPHLGYIVLITPPTQSSGSDGNGNPISYSDTTVYSKKALGTFMSTRYNGSIALLNSAWGSNYTTFGSSGGWGSGSGLMDEDGRHSWVGTDSIKLSGETATMQADLNAFLLYYCQQYFSTIKTALHTAAPGVLYLGPTNMGGWGGPPRAQILQAAGQYVDVIAISSIPTGCLSCSTDQARIDFVAKNGGNKPWINWEGFFAQSDSYMSPYSAPETSYPQSTTQAQRGQIFTTMVSQQLTAKDSSTSTYHIVGYKWWELYDNRGETANWGLLTRRDNGYDGGAVTGKGMDSFGYPTGGEQMDYGNFLDSVTTANFNIYKTLLNLP